MKNLSVNAFTLFFVGTAVLSLMMSAADASGGDTEEYDVNGETQAPTAASAPPSFKARRETKAPTNPGVKGDPHFQTWTGESYDFHGVCDLVLVHNAGFGNGIGMDVHVRTERIKLWSYVSSVAIRIGDDIFEVMGGADIKFWVNGVEGERRSIKVGTYESSLVSTISGYPIYEKQESGNSEFVINLGDDEKITIGVWHSFVRVFFKNLRSEDFKGSAGLLGSFPDGVKLARDKTTILEHFNLFGQEWQVLDSEVKLFHNIKGPQHPSKCEIPTKSEMRRRLGESKITIEEATEACIHVNEAELDLCIFDVVATNDKVNAGAY